MPKLYRVGGSVGNPNYIRQDFSLADRLTSKRNAFIEGFRFVERENAVPPLGVVIVAEANTGKAIERTPFRGMRLLSVSPFETFISD